MCEGERLGVDRMTGMESDVIESPYRAGNVIPQTTRDAGADLRDLVESQSIEFFELMTAAKYQD